MSDWNRVKIGDVCIVERGGSPRPIDKYITEREDGINWIKIGDTSDSMYITSTAQRIIPEGMKKSRYVKAGDFLLSNSMSFGRPYILKIDGCIHDGWLVLRDENGLFDKRFLYYYLSASVTYEKFKKMAVGGVVNNLNSEMVRGVTIPLPQRSEQEFIADTLDDVSNLISLRKQQLAKLDELVKSRFVEMFGDPLLDDGRYPKVPLATLADVGSSKRIFEKEYVSEGVPFYRTKEIVELSKGNRITTELFISRERYEEIRDEYGVPQKGDLLISAVGTIGVIWIVDGKNDFYFKDGNLLRVAASDNFAPTYIKHLLEALIGAYKKEMSSGTAYAALTISALKEMPVYMVPITEQEQFAAFVEQTDKSKFEIQTSLEKLETLKKALMQKYFG